MVIIVKVQPNFDHLKTKIYRSLIFNFAQTFANTTNIPRIYDF